MEPIHLDTNIFIGLILDQPISATVRRLQEDGNRFACSAVVWSELLNGPCSQASILAMRALLEDRIVPFERADAEIAARLFNATGRKRGLRFDSMIAAQALRRGATLLTLNHDDFAPFAPLGLELVSCLSAELFGIPNSPPEPRRT
ncbi:MAG TPA: PIN domain-containing protein [Fibrobacteria bacterium]|nr:PIN domain-containing protein [Fibrobacteria bacterium]